jgi:hypothetical protein
MFSAEILLKIRVSVVRIRPWAPFPPKNPLLRLFRLGDGFAHIVGQGAERFD